MFKKILLWLGLAIVIFISILLINTFRSKPWPVNTQAVKQDPLPDSAVAHMSEAIQLQTISVSDSSTIDTATFLSFDAFIERAYPGVHSQLVKTRINTFSL